MHGDGDKDIVYLVGSTITTQTEKACNHNLYDLLAIILNEVFPTIRSHISLILDDPISEKLRIELFKISCNLWKQ
jgi:hypothetical protein